jgi:hypothetical protein
MSSFVRTSSFMRTSLVSLVFISLILPLSVAFYVNNGYYRTHYRTPNIIATSNVYTSRSTTNTLFGDLSNDDNDYDNEENTDSQTSPLDWRSFRANLVAKGE